MSHRHYPPAYLRYLKARLWNLGRPGFWVTAIFLSVVGLVTWQYWSNPDIFVYKQKKQVASQKPADSSLSDENKAIAADIDNLPVLFNDFDQASLSLTANTPKENTEQKKSKGLLEDLINKQKSISDSKLKPSLGLVNPEPPPVLNNPFITQTENLLRTGMVDTNSQLIGLKSLNAASETEREQTSSSLGIGLTNQTNKNQNSLSISPLQAELNQSTNQNLSSFNGVSPTQTNVLGRVSGTGTTLMPPMNSLPSQNSLPSTGSTPGTGYTSTGTNLPPNSYGNFNSGQAPVTPPINSVAPTNITPYSNQSPSQSVVTPTNPAGYGNYGWQQPTQLPQSTSGNYGLQQPTQTPQSTFGNYGLQQPTQTPQSTSGNYVLQQPTQSNSLYLRQIRDKYRGTGQN